MSAPTATRVLPVTVRGRRRPSRETLLLAAVVAVGAVLRAVPVRGVWLDEAISVAQARRPYGEMIHQLATADLHPPLWATVLWLDVRLLGDGPFALRVPSLIVGTLCVPLVYLLARELYDRRTGMVAAVFTALSPLAVWYSGEARMYGFYLFWSVLALLGQTYVFRDRPRLGWILFVVASVGLLCTQYFSFLQLLAQHLVFAVIVIRRRVQTRETSVFLRPWLLSIAATAVLMLPLVPYLGAQLENFSSPGASPGVSDHQPVALYVVMANMMWGLYGYHPAAAMTQLVALWPAGMLIILGMLGKGRSWQALMLTSAIVIPVGLAFAMSARSRTFFEIRYFISVLPPILVLASRAATGWLSGTRARAVAVGAVVLTLVAGLADQQLNPANPRQYAYDRAFALIDAEARPGDLLVFAPDYLDPVVAYYHPGRPAQPLRDGSPLPAGHTGRIVLVASFLDQPDTANLVGRTLANLEQDGRTVQRTAQWENVTLWILG